MARKIDERDLAPRAFVEPVSPLSGETVERIAILIPGIRTNAEWTIDASRFHETFDVPVKGKRTFGGRISSLHLITRIGLKGIRSDIKSQIIRIKIDHPHAEISLVCHSMGTDMIVDILEEIDFNFKYIFFIGAVCKVKRARNIRRRCEIFINHVGVKDEWPILATLARPDRYSPSGTFGFGRDAFVNDIFFSNDHFTCTDIDHVGKLILPVIAGISPLYPDNVEHKFSFNNAYYIRIATYVVILLSIIGSFYASAFMAIIPVVMIVAVVCFYIFSS